MNRRQRFCSSTWLHVDACYKIGESPEGTLAAVDPLVIEAPKLDHAPDESRRPQPGHRSSARVPSAEEPHFQSPAEDIVEVDTVVSDAPKLGHAPDESPCPQHGAPFLVSTQGSHFESKPEDIADPAVIEEPKLDHALDGDIPRPQAGHESAYPSVEGLT